MQSDEGNDELMKEIKKNDTFVVTIEDMSDTGAGIGKLEGYTWFIKDGLIGDVVEAAAMKMKKNYGFARLVRVLEPAKGRVPARCPVASASCRSFPMTSS